MRTDPMPGNFAATLCAALLLGLVVDAANAPLLAAPPNPAQATARIPPVNRTFVAETVAALLPADLVSTVRVSYQQNGWPISPNGSTSGTYSATKGNPGWVTVAVRNNGTINSPDGTPQHTSFAFLVRITSNRRGGTVVPQVETVVKDYTFTETLQAGGTYLYGIPFDPFPNKIMTGIGQFAHAEWHPMTVEVKVDPPNQVKESNENNNNFTYTVNFTD